MGTGLAKRVCEGHLHQVNTDTGQMAKTQTGNARTWSAGSVGRKGHGHGNRGDNWLVWPTWELSGGKCMDRCRSACVMAPARGWRGQDRYGAETE
eukprot:15482171-Alexandrium_andersonii.AAC.2